MKFLIKSLAVILLCIFILLPLTVLKSPLEKDLDKLTNFILASDKSEKINRADSDIFSLTFSTKGEIYIASVLVYKGKTEANAIMVVRFLFESDGKDIPVKYDDFKFIKQAMLRNNKMLVEENIFDHLRDGEIDIFQRFTKTHEGDFKFIRDGVEKSKDGSFRTMTGEEKKMIHKKYSEIVKIIMKHYEI